MQTIHVLTTVKRFVPRQLKQWVRQLQSQRAFRVSMKRFMKSPESCLDSNSPTLSQLSKAWGNEGWSGSTEYLAECVRQVSTVQGPILECGSGLSTLLIAATARRRGIDLWSLEHIPAWAARVQGTLDAYKLHNANLCVSGLRDYGQFVWYDPPVDQLPSKFGLVVCDGPPATTRGGRYGLAVMKSRLLPGCTILLDDAVRQEERAIAERWRTELNADLEACGHTRPYIKLTVRD